MRFLAAIPVVVALSAANAVAQSKPDFSGTWLRVGTPASTQEMTIKHDGATLAIGAGQDKVVFNVGGPDTKMPGPDGTYSLTKAAWQDNAIAVTTTFYVNGTVGNVRRQAWAVDSLGGLLTIE